METKISKDTLQSIIDRVYDVKYKDFERSIQGQLFEGLNPESILHAQEVAKSEYERRLNQISSYQEELILVSQLAELLLMDRPLVSVKEYYECLTYILHTANDTFLDIASLLGILKR